MQPSVATALFVVTLAAVAPSDRLAAQSPARRTDADGAPPAPITTTWAAPRPVVRGAPGGALAVGNRFLSTDQAPEGDHPAGLDFTPDGQLVLVVNRDTDTVTFLDVTSRIVVATVTVGDYPVAIDVSADGLWAVVPNVFDDTVSILSVPARAVVATVPVSGVQPYAVHVTADSQKAVVGVINDAVNSALSVVDLGTFAEVRVVATGGQGVIGGFATPERGISGELFTEFAVSPDSATAVVPERGLARVGLYDVTTGATLALLPTPTLPTAVDIDAAGTLAVVSHEGAARAISRIDLLTRTLAGPAITLPQNLENQVIALQPGNSHALVAISNAVAFVDLATGAVAATVSTGTVGDLGISFDGQYAFVSNFNARVLHLPSRTLVATIPFEAGVDVAMSPVAHRAVMLDNRFLENVVVFGTDGASAAVEGVVASGPPAEGDGTRALAISPDGRTLVACNIVSGNVAVVDAAAEQVRAWIETGVRTWAAQITPDGGHAVVTNCDASTVSVIDLATDVEVARLSVPTRPTEVEIAPDGSKAYVTTIAGTDRLAVIALNGAASSVVASVPTGQLGTILYTFGVSSGIAMSPDGSLLAICVSFDDQLKLLDTATNTIVATLPTGDFPVRARFSPDGSRLYVACAFGDSVDVYAVAGAATSPLATVGGIEFPLDLVVDAAGAFLYVGCYDFVAPRVAVVDLATNTLAGAVPLPDQPYTLRWSPADGVLYATTTDSQLFRIAAAGGASAVIDVENLSAPASDLVFSESLRRAYAAQPGRADGIDVVAYGGRYVDYGAGTPGTGGVVPQLDGLGVPTQGAAITIQTSQALPNTFGLVAIGFVPIAFPLWGGTLLVLPDWFELQLVSPAGAASLPLLVPDDPAVLGADAYLQGLYADAGAAGGVSFSPGLLVQVR